MEKKRIFLRVTVVLFGVGALYLASAAMGGFARPVRGLWPAAEGAESYRVIVSMDRWHSMIGVWPRGADEGDLSKVEEWGYVDKLFSLDRDDGLRGTLRAMAVPSLGAVQRIQAGQPWSKRTQQPPARQWSFQISATGYERLQAHLAEERATATPLDAERFPGWFPAAQSYHALHHCHHWTTRALRAAGLPFWSSYSLFQWSFERQLDRATTFGKKRKKKK